MYIKNMKQLDPKAVWLFFLGYVLRWLIPVAVILAYGTIALYYNGNSRFAFGVTDSLPNYPALGPIIFIIVVVFLLLCYIWAKLTYHFYRYELTEQGFRKESGVIYKRYVTIPYNRIQNVDIYRGIIARILGLSDLQIQTAGASAVITRYGAAGIGAEGRLPGVSFQTAEALRNELIERVHKSSQKSGGL